MADLTMVFSRELYKDFELEKSLNAQRPMSYSLKSWAIRMLRQMQVMELCFVKFWRQV